ncbi:helix-turn-helix domain-containing protein [Polaribacter ponticola]|uniref:Helix-turn-helix transcriptional regulator n=1 Tax=Polaribacter ponticola TaxID=2978475 RepID=A0ABT5SBB5_9FLAO|nr:helix-turn-helix transcriptional regulator [Polaribacter sp. MSW5]MDD7915365.1 helix-turn-helix transcriptional regulator [Polaribacter sp. MSW5]
MSKRERKKEIPNFCVEFGKHLRKLRKENNLSIEEIAFKAEIDAQNLRKYELGKQEMKISMLKRISDAFGISPSELIDFR